MKKIYMQPLAEVADMELEQMIAASVDGFDSNLDNDEPIDADNMLERLMGVGDATLGL